MAQPYSVVKAALDAAVAASGGKFQPFDAKYYVQTYSVVKNENGSVVDDSLSKFGGDPLQHYVEQGAAKGFKPNAWFDPTFYRAQYPDTQTLAEGDLLVHYAKFGVNEGRAPSTPLAAFDGARYLRDNPDVAAYVNANLPSFGGSVTNGAIAHYVKFGANEGRHGYNITGGDVGFTTYAAAYAFASSTGTAGADSVALNLNTNGGHTMLTGSNAVIDAGAGTDTLRLIGDAAARIDLTNSGSQLRGVDLNGNGAIEANGVENNLSGAQKVTVKNFEIVDAYARNPLMPSDMSKNYTGKIAFDGTGYNGDGTSTNGNIFLGGLGNDTALGGIGNDFLAGGGSASGDTLSGGRNADFFFIELSKLDKTDGNGSAYDGGNTADDTSAGGTLPTGAFSSQDSDWVLLEASDDDEPVNVNFSTDSLTTRSGQYAQISEMENLNASGNLYGILNDVDAKLGNRSVDARSVDPIKGTENYGIGSTAQLNVTGNAKNNVLIGGFDNDTISGGAGKDLIAGGDLGYLLRTKNNPNLIDANGGLSHTNARNGNVVDGVDNLQGGNDDDNIIFEMDGGQVNGGADNGTSSGANLNDTGDTLWLTDFSMGRKVGATLAGEATAQADGLANVTTDSTVRIDLGNNGAATFKNYGGSNAATQDQSNYKAGIAAVTMQGMESVIATGLGDVDYKAAGGNSPELQFNNQQNYKAINANLDLRGTDADNTLYANTGKDVIEGRGGDDNLSGGTNDDDFVFTYGDGVDTIHRQKDANGDNLWDQDATTKAFLFTQDFRAPQQGDISSSSLVVDFGTTDLTSPNVAVTSFFLKIGGVSFNVTDQAALAAAKSATALASVVNAAYHSQDAKVSVVAVGNSLVVTDTSGRDISDTVPEGFAVAGVVGNSSFATTATFTPGGTPTNIVENDRLIFKTYDARSINLGKNETTNEINNASALVAKFDASGTQLAEGQKWQVRLTDVREGDKVTLNVNGKEYSYTAKAGETSDVVATALAAVVNNELDLNSASGKVGASVVAGSAPFTDTDGVGANVAIVEVSQSIVGGSQVYMNLTTTLTNTLTGKASGMAEIHNQSNTHIDLVGFDGRNGTLNGDDVLFLGRTNNSVSLLQTAKNAGETLTGKDATDDQDTDFAWINGDDLLIGGDGNDTINGGTGDDVILVSKGTDTVNGGGNVTEAGSTVAFTDTLQAEEYIFGAGSRFAVALDGTLGAKGKGVLVAQDSKSATLGTTNFDQIEVVRVLENSRASSLDVQALSDNVATAVGNNSLTAEGLTVNMTRSAPSVAYTVDANNDGAISGAADSKDAATGDYNAFNATQVYGAENLKTGNANDTVNIDESQASANNTIDLGSQQDNTVLATLREGADKVVYDHTSSGLLAAALRPTMTVKVESASNTDSVSMTGGALGTAVTTDTLIGAEELNVTNGATGSKLADTLDVSAISAGAVINYGVGETVQKSLGGALTPVDTVAKLEANTFESGGVSVVGNNYGNELIEITGIQQLERVTGSAASDRVIVGNVMQQGSITRAIVDAAAGKGDSATLDAADITKLTYISPSSKEADANDRGLYQFNLGAGSDDAIDYKQETGNVAVLVDTSATAAAATSTDWVLVDSNANNALNDLGDRIDYATDVERYFGGQGVNIIDLNSATVDTTIQFSKEAKSNTPSNEYAEPNGNDTVTTTDLTRTAEVRSTSDSTVFAKFVDRTNANPADAAAGVGQFWTRVEGGALNETVVFSDNETAVAHTLNLAGGTNVANYNALSSVITAAIGTTSTAGVMAQTVTANGDTITQSHTPVAASNYLTIVGSAKAGDIVDVTGLDTTHIVAGQLSSVDKHYSVIDLAAGTVTEDLYGQYGTNTTFAMLTKVTGFESVTNAGNNDVVHIIGDGSANTLIGGTGADEITGGNGTGTAANGGDTLTGGVGADWFIYSAEIQSPGGSVTGNNQNSNVFGAGAAGDTAVINSRDTISDFLAGTDKLVFQIDDGYEAVKVTAALPSDLGGGGGAGVVAYLGKVAGTYAAGTTQVDIDRDATAASLYARDDNYRMATTAATLTNADLLVRVAASSGSDKIDAGAGNATTKLNAAAAADDGIRVDVVYSAASESQGATYDTILNFRSGQDKIDLSFLQANRWAIQYGNSVYDLGAGGVGAGNGASDAIEAVRTLPASPIVAFNADAPGLFNDGGNLRAVAIQTAIDGNGDASTTVFVDANHDGNYTVGQDMVISLVGTSTVVLGDFIFDHY